MADYAVVDDESLPAIIESEVANAIGHWDGLLAAERKIELDYYNGRPFGNEVEGESQVVSTDVADTIEGILPSILRIFTASDDAVRFDPNGPEDEEVAKQMSDVCNYVFYRQNNGFLVLYEWFKDALIQKNGIVKYWWEQKADVSHETYQGLTEGQYLLLKQQPEVEIIEEKSYDDPAAAQQKQFLVEQVKQTVPAKQRSQALAQLDAQKLPQLYDCKLKITRDASKCCIQAIPPEEFGISAKHNCVSIQDTPFCYHRGRQTISQLREAGCPENVIADIHQDSEADISPESFARDRFLVDQTQRDNRAFDPSMREIWVTECFIRIDYDGDGLAELRHIIMPGRTIWVNEEAEHINFAALTPVIMPHRWVGRSVSELVADIQFTKSVIWRQMLNNLYLTNNPRKAVLSSAGGIVQANLDDLLTSRPGGIVREYAPNAVRDLETPFVANASFPMLEYMDGIKENRTGVTRYNQGTDANSLNKMLDIHTPVPMADGSSKLLRDILDGDRIIGSSGNPVTVIKAHEIHDPERAYRMVFASGEEIIAGGEHLWTVLTERDKAAGMSRTINTDVIFKRKQEFAENLYIPRLQRPLFGDGELPVNPYLLGCWLGDGTSAKSAITTMDQEIVDAFVADGWNMYKDKTQNSGEATTWCIGSYKAALRQDGTTGRMIATGAAWLTKMTQLGIARNKHIPQAYFVASYEDRLELLRGLMDTDGCHHSRSLVVFSQKDGRLLADTIKLIEGLGGWPRLSEVDPGDAGKEGQTYWNVNFHLFDNPFHLSRKANKWIAPERNVSTQPIVSVESVPVRPMRCLTVDSNDGLFCVGRRFTVTHNTARGINAIMSAGQQRIDLIARIFAETGVKDLFRGIAYMLSRYSSKGMTVKLRNKWVDVDPREWKTQFNTIINVGLGTGNRDVQLQHLSALHESQIALMKEGRGYMVTDENLFNLYTKMSEAMGFKHPELFVTDPRAIPPQAKQPPPDPAAMKVQADAQEGQAKLSFSAQKEQLNSKTMKEVEQIKADALLRVAAIDAQTKKDIAAMELEQKAKLEVFKAHAGVNTDFERWKTELVEATKVLVAQISAKSALDTTAIQAEAASDKIVARTEAPLKEQISSQSQQVVDQIGGISKILDNLSKLHATQIQMHQDAKKNAGTPKKISLENIQVGKDGIISGATVKST